MDGLWFLPFNETIESLLESNEVCVVGVFGKSSWGHTAKSTIINVLSKTYHYPNVYPGDQKENSKNPDNIPTFECYYDPHAQILYVHMTSIYDAAKLSSVCSSVQSHLSSHSETHDMWKCHEVGHVFGLVYLFSICHILIVVHPVSTFDISYDRLFQRVASLRVKLVPTFKDILKECTVGRDWWVNGRPCPPRLLFVFQRCHLSFGPDKKQILGHETGDGDKAIGMKRKKPPIKRLQHTIEDQVYKILRNSRVLTNSAVNCLFTVPPNQAFVHIMSEEFDKISKDEDPILGMLKLLQQSCIEHRNPNIKSKASELLTDQTMYWPEEQEEENERGSSSTLRGFLLQHVHLVLDKKGFNDSSGRNPQPSHFELPTIKNWLKVSNGLYNLLFTAGPTLGPDFSSPKAQKSTTEANKRFMDDVFVKVRNCRQFVRSKLDIEMKFSESRCSKILPMAVNIYQNNLPNHYTSKVHNNQLTQAMLMYNHHARGPATDQFRDQLQDECIAFWQNGRQLCEVHSLTDRHCVHRFHILASSNQPPDPDHDPPILYHTSRSRSSASSNCGTVQGMRDDPFELKEANFDFYAQLDKKAPLAPVEIYNFPVCSQDNMIAINSQQLAFSGAVSSQALSAEEPRNLQESVITQDDDRQDERVRTISDCQSVGDAASTQGSGKDEAEDASSQEQEIEEKVSPTKQSSAESYNVTAMSNNLSFALSGCQSDGGAYEQSTFSPLPNNSPVDVNMDENQDAPKSYEKIIFNEVDPMYLNGMLHSNCPPGLFPIYPSWSLVKLGAADYYTPARGLDFPGFMPGTGYLVPWDIQIPVKKDDAISWPMPGKSAKTSTTKKTTVQQRPVIKTDGETVTVKAYIGCEYETLRGQRFICSGPDKTVKVTSSGAVRDNYQKLINSEMPLYTQCSASSRSGKPLLGQLMRVYVVTPNDAAVQILLNPQVVPGPAPTPTFYPTTEEISLGPNSMWVLRLPYVYVSDMGTHFAPKDFTLLPAYKALNTLFKVNILSNEST